MEHISICSYKKYNDIVSNYILFTHCWDGPQTLKILKASEYYSEKKF